MSSHANDQDDSESCGMDEGEEQQSFLKVELMEQTIQEETSKSSQAQIEPKVKAECPECGKHLSNVKEHIKQVHSNVKEHACNDCSYRSCFKKDLKKHVRAKHGKALEDDRIEANVTGGVIEPFVGIGKVHTNQTESNKTTQCPLCQKYLTNINEHLKSVHAKEKNFFCNECDYETMFRSDLLKHDELVHKKVKKSCQECGKQVANLPEHVRMVHRKEKNFKCNYCGYSCAKQSDMKKHTKNVHKVTS